MTQATNPELIFTALPDGYQVDLIEHNTSSWPLLRLHCSPTEGVTTTVEKQRGEIYLGNQENLHADLLSSVDLLADAFTTLARRLRAAGPAPLNALLSLLRETEGKDILTPAFTLEGDPRQTACEIIPTAPPEERRAGIGGLEPRLILTESGADANINEDDLLSFRLVACEPGVTPPYEQEDVTVYHLTNLLWPPGVTGPNDALVAYTGAQPFGYFGLLNLATQGETAPITGTVSRIDRDLGRLARRILETGETLTAEQVLLAAEQISNDSTPRDLLRTIEQTTRAIE